MKWFWSRIKASGDTIAICWFSWWLLYSCVGFVFVQAGCTLSHITSLIASCFQKKKKKAPKSSKLWANVGCCNSLFQDWIITDISMHCYSLTDVLRGSFERQRKDTHTHTHTQIDFYGKSPDKHNPNFVLTLLWLEGWIRFPEGYPSEIYNYLNACTIN